MRHRDFSKSKAMQRLVARYQSERAQYSALLQQMAAFIPQLKEIPQTPAQDSLSPYWRNGYMLGLDAASLYGLVTIFNPKTYLEVGSGHSTKFVRKAIRDHKLQTRIISIDPRPRSMVDKICNEIYRVPLQTLDLTIFNRLTNGDMMFFDCSHQSLMGSDVTVFFLEILGGLAKGVVYGIHDIVLPNDYPESWADRNYNEQYLMACYLFGGADGDQIVLPNSFVVGDAGLKSILGDICNLDYRSSLGAGSTLWMRKC